MTNQFDVAVVGGGFAGSLFALAAKRAGRSVVLIEKARHPRFAIGESTSPLANLLLEGLCDDYGLDRVRPLTAFGSWRRERPEIDCGLKRGFTFFSHREGEPWARGPARESELLVAASPNDEVADTHWLRADVDAFLFSEARREGVECIEETRAESMEADSGSWVLSTPAPIRARFVVDASGPRGFLQRALGIGEARFEGLPRVEGLFSHFRNAGPFPFPSGSNGETPPYPPDAAAVHHVLDGGWVWALRFESGLVSAGVAAVPSLARSLRLEEGAAAWARLLDRYPSLREQFGRAEPTRDFTCSPCLSYRASHASGPAWTMLPSAAAFVDPLLSTGIPLALAGVHRLARIVDREWDQPDFDENIAAAGRRTLAEADAAGLLVAALYAAMGDFELFTALTLLYFAAASFAEAATRLGRPSGSRGFLLIDHHGFAPAFRRVCRDVLQSSSAGNLHTRRREILLAVSAAIEPVDVIGLAAPGRRNWHPFENEALLEGAGKLGATRSEVSEMLARCAAAPAARTLG